MDQTCIILFTTGSEKYPKAVELTHRNFSSNSQAVSDFIGVTEHDVFISVLPFFHVFGLTSSMWIPLRLGATIVSHANPLEYAKIPASVKKFKGTFLCATPTFALGYLRRANLGDFDSLRLLVTGGDKTPPHLIEEYQREHGVIVCEGYGCTETSPVISINDIDNVIPGSIGRVLPGVEVEIRHNDSHELLSAGEVGKILVKGDLVMKGYLGDIEETSVRIKNGWYDTGDMGMIDQDGVLWHKGRLRRFVKIGGEMISLASVEDHVGELLPEGVLCCAVDLPDPIKGSQVVMGLSAVVNIKELKKNIKRVLPKISLPRDYIVLDDFPIMGNGKVNFREVALMCRRIKQ